MYVHCAGWDLTDWKMVADTGGTVSISPATEMFMSMNIPPLQQALDVSIRPSLSVDAEANAPTDMFTEMRLALASQHSMLMVRSAAGEESLPARLTARDALALATIEGARANGLDSRTGSLTPGKQADVILLRHDTINVMPVNNPIGAIVYGMDTSNVDSVYVGGCLRKQDGKLVGAIWPASQRRSSRPAPTSRVRLRADRNPIGCASVYHIGTGANRWRKMNGRLERRKRQTSRPRW